MLDINLKECSDYRKSIASKARERRLFHNISQQELADRSGVSLGSIKRFERTGLISLSSLLEIALVLGCLKDFDCLFSPPDMATLDLYQTSPKRPRRRASATSKH